MSYAIGEAKADFVRAQAARSLRLIPFMALQVLCLLQRQLELYHEAALYKEDRRRKRRARWVMAEASSKFMRGGFNAMGRLAARLLLKMGRKPPPLAAAKRLRGGSAGARDENAHNRSRSARPARTASVLLLTRSTFSGMAAPACGASFHARTVAHQREGHTHHTRRRALTHTHTFAAQ